MSVQLLTVWQRSLSDHLKTGYEVVRAYSGSEALKLIPPEQAVNPCEDVSCLARRLGLFSGL